MCQTQFLQDAHDIMIGDAYEEIGTRRAPCFNLVDKHKYFQDKRRYNAMELKAEEAMHLNAYNAKLAHLLEKEVGKS